MTKSGALCAAAVIAIVSTVSSYANPVLPGDHPNCELGVARAKQLFGPRERPPTNPILAGQLPRDHRRAADLSKAAPSPQVAPHVSVWRVLKREARELARAAVDRRDVIHLRL